MQSRKSVKSNTHFYTLSSDCNISVKVAPQTSTTHYLNSYSRLHIATILTHLTTASASDSAFLLTLNAYHHRYYYLKERRIEYVTR